MRILEWIVGREPVATATGIATVITAGLGVAAAFGVDITAEQIAALGALAAALAGWAGRRAVTPTAKLSQPAGTLEEAGSVPMALIILIGLAVVLLAGLAVCTDALFEDEQERDDLGRPRVVLISHERDRCYNGDCDDGSGNEGEYRDDNRRAGISPGPFDRSPVDFRDNRVTICFPFARCDSEAQPGESPSRTSGRP